MKKFIIIAMLAVILQGCSTRYKKEFWGTGYSEVRLSENIFSVVFKGNSSTTRDKAYDFLLLRDAELTLSNGYQYFSFLSSRDDTQYNYNGYNGNITTVDGSTHIEYSPVFSNTIVCSEEQLEGVFNFDATFVYTSIHEKHGYFF